MQKVAPFKNKALEIVNFKKRLSFVKELFLNNEVKFSQIDKLNLLKDLLKGEKAYLLSCGPTLLDHETEKLNSLVRENLTFAIKQSYDLFSENVDVHFYNCANYKNYDYGNNLPIVFEASTSPAGVGKEHDVRFLIKERNFNNSVSSTGDFQSWTFEKQPFLRPYGPGIMYEMVFFAAQHLGISELITIGWDNKLINKDASKQHFYDMAETKFDKDEFIHQNEVAKSVKFENLEHEAKITSEAISPFYFWLRECGCELKIVSELNPAPKFIERITL